MKRESLHVFWFHGVVVMRFFLYPLVCCLLSGVFSVQKSFAVQQVEDIDRLRANVLALDRVQDNILKDIASRNVAGTISMQERNELLIFVGYLQDRNRDYCAQLEQYAGHAAVADLPCPGERVTLPEARTKTMDEELAALDQSLAESLGAFDEMLLKEQEGIAARHPRQRESGEGTGSGSSGGGTGSGSSGGNGEGRDGDEGDGGQTGSGKSQQPTTAGQGQDQSAGTTASGAPGQGGDRTGHVNRPGRDELSADDDIVARQLREAAEKETDPELKEKLWEEYRKYKAGS